MTAEDFLAWDEHETIKREFVRGEVFAMAGADEPHVTASMNVAMGLRQHLRAGRQEPLAHAGTARPHPAPTASQGRLHLLQAGPDLGELGLDCRPSAEVRIDRLGDGGFVIDEKALQATQAVSAFRPRRTRRSVPRYCWLSCASARQLSARRWQA